jgi:hypothetical protein
VKAADKQLQKLAVAVERFGYGRVGNFRSAGTTVVPVTIAAGSCEAYGCGALVAPIKSVQRFWFELRSPSCECAY